MCVFFLLSLSTFCRLSPLLHHIKLTHLRRHCVGPPAPLPPDDADDALDARRGGGGRAEAPPPPPPPPGAPPPAAATASRDRGWEARWTQPALRTRSVEVVVVDGCAGGWAWPPPGRLLVGVREKREGEWMEKEVGATLTSCRRHALSLSRLQLTHSRAGIRGGTGGRLVRRCGCVCGGGGVGAGTAPLFLSLPGPAAARSGRRGMEAETSALSLTSLSRALSLTLGGAAGQCPRPDTSAARTRPSVTHAPTLTQPWVSARALSPHK